MSSSMRKAHARKNMDISIMNQNLNTNISVIDENLFNICSEKLQQCHRRTGRDDSQSSILKTTWQHRKNPTENDVFFFKCQHIYIIRLLSQSHQFHWLNGHRIHLRRAIFPYSTHSKTQRLNHHLGHESSNRQRQKIESAKTSRQTKMLNIQ